MKTKWLYLCLCLFFCIGCGEHRNANLYKKRLTIQDLEPQEHDSLQPQIFFEIITFELPAGHVKDIPSGLMALGQSDIRFDNKSYCSANGLAVFFGDSAKGGKLTEQLQFLDARRVGRSSIATVDKASELFATATFPVKQYVFTTEYGDRTVGHDFLPGQIGWLISPKLTVRQDTIEVAFMPAYFSPGSSYIRQVAGQTEYDPVFSGGRVELVMREKDFLVLAPTRQTTEQTLDKLLFGADRKKDVMRLYVVIFSNLQY